MTTPSSIGKRIGKAMARDVLADDMPRAWTGLDAQDGDELLADGFEPSTPEWSVAQAAAKVAYHAALRGD